MVRSAPPKSEAEYVVVGSGSAGAALAGRLALAGRSVILLEAGKHDNRFLVKKPGMIGPMHAEPRIKRTVDWGYYSTPQHHLLDRRMPVPRGKVVGGSSSINGMVYVRGNRAELRRLGRRGQHRLVGRRGQRRLQADGGLRGRRERLRGAGGPIRITRNKTPQEGTLHFIQATADTLGVKVLDDYNAASQEGIARMQQNAGRRAALQRLARLPPPPGRPDARPADPGARDPGGDRERPGHRRRGAGPGRVAPGRARGAGGDPGRGVRAAPPSC